MKGYLVCAGDVPMDSCARRLNLPVGEASYREKLGESLSLIIWGGPEGDVSYSITQGESVLVFNGYVGESKSIVEFETQQRAVTLLSESFHRATSVDQMIQIADSIHGSFSIVYCNPKEKRVYCITDRIASRPIWIRKSGTAWVISSHVNPLIEFDGNREFDLGSLGSFLLYGGLVDPTKSMYRSIRAVNEGAVTILPFAGDAQVQTWYAFRHVPDKKCSRREWVQLATERVRQSAARILRTSKKPLVFLSGGVDSRLTASALCSAGGAPLLVTLGDSENLEVKIAKRVANALKCRHETVFRDRLWYLRSLSTAAYNSAGAYVWTHAHFSQAYRECLKENAVDCAFLGDFCEAFSKLLCDVNRSRRNPWTPEEFYQEFDMLPLPQYRPADRARTLSLLTLKVRKLVEEQLRMDLMNRYSECREVSEEPKVIADHFLVWRNASTYATYIGNLDLRSVGCERGIMFDKDLQCLLEIMPGAIRNNTNLGAEIVRALSPKAARVPNSNTLLPLRFPPVAHSAASALRPVAGKLRRLFIENSYHTTGSWPKLQLLYREDRDWRSYFEESLNREVLYSQGVFDRKAIRESWERFCKGDMTLASDLEKLVTLAHQHE